MFDTQKPALILLRKIAEDTAVRAFIEAAEEDELQSYARALAALFEREMQIPRECDQHHRHDDRAGRIGAETEEVREIITAETHFMSVHGSLALVRENLWSRVRP